MATKTRQKKRDYFDNFTKYVRREQPDVSSRHLEKPQSTTKIRVILTGSTGNLGSYLLDCLLNTPHVTRITCLNRPHNASERQASSQHARGLTDILNDPRVEFIKCDLSQPGLGMPPDAYSRLVATATHLIHNAWPVSFNLSFSSFEPQIRGVKNLIDFTARCDDQTILFFISSVSVVGRWGTLAGALEKVPEVQIDDWRSAKMGYGQSKLISEMLIAEGCKANNIRGAICRVGQLGGPVRRGEAGKWNPNEWFPSLLKSSEYLGVIPRDLGPMENVDWVPIDVCAEVIVELLLATTEVPQLNGYRKMSKAPQQQPSFYHVANPKMVSYSSLLSVLTEHISSEKELKTTSFCDWVNQLVNSAKLPNVRPSSEKDSNCDWEQNPAVKLISYFDELRDKADRFPEAQTAKLDTTASQSLSPTLEKLQAIDEETMKLWLRQWGYKE